MKSKPFISVFVISLMLGLQTVMAASSTYYAKTTVYFNVPTDATFSIAMPSDYTSWTVITGTTEGGANTTDYISFNFTSANQATLQEPYQLGVSANAQDGMTKPIYYIDNTGNVNEKFEIRYSADPSTGISLYHNATCTGACAGTETTATTNTTTSYQQLTDTMATDEYLNVTLYSNASLSLSGGITSIDVYIKSSAV